MTVIAIDNKTQERNFAQCLNLYHQMCHSRGETPEAPDADASPAETLAFYLERFRERGITTPLKHASLMSDADLTESPAIWLTAMEDWWVHFQYEVSRIRKKNIADTALTRRDLPNDAPWCILTWGGSPTVADSFADWIAGMQAYRSRYAAWKTQFHRWQASGSNDPYPVPPPPPLKPIPRYTPEPGKPFDPFAAVRALLGEAEPQNSSTPRL
jgi:hypothetical protein